jgi:hypothetical protein
MTILEFTSLCREAEKSEGGEKSIYAVINEQIELLGEGGVIRILKDSSVDQVSQILAQPLYSPIDNGLEAIEDCIGFTVLDILYERKETTHDNTITEQNS